MPKTKPTLTAILLAALLAASVNPSRVTQAQIGQSSAPFIRITTTPDISKCQMPSGYILTSRGQGESFIEVSGYDGKEFPRDQFATALMAAGQCGATVAFATVSPPPKSVWDQILAESDNFGSEKDAQKKVDDTQNKIRSLPDLLGAAKFKIKFLGKGIELPIPTDGLQQVVNRITVERDKKHLLIKGPAISSQLRSLIMIAAGTAAGKNFH